MTRTYREHIGQNRITEEGLREVLSPELRDSPVYVFDEIGSTNSYAKSLVSGGEGGEKAGRDRPGPPRPSLIVANRQTEGRGRLGRTFFSPDGGLYMSIAIGADFEGETYLLVTAAAAAAAARAIDEISGREAGIKWVNDIYIDGRKVCGILTEAVSGGKSGRIDNVIIGIGVNTSLRGFPAELLRIAGAVDLAGPHEGGPRRREADAKALLAAKIFEYTLEYTGQIGSTSPGFLKLYREKSLLTGREIRVFKGACRLDPSEESGGLAARVVGIDELAGLQVVYAGGGMETLRSGEVSVRL